jgi:hypothetical protein
MSRSADQQRDYYYKHREKILARVAAYRLKNLEKFRARDRDNKRKHKDTDRKYVAANKEKIKAYQKARYKAK